LVKIILPQVNLLSSFTLRYQEIKPLPIASDQVPQQIGYNSTNLVYLILALFLANYHNQDQQGR